MAAKNVIFRKKIAGVLYDLLPQTSFAQVINGDSKTLETIVSELTAALATKATTDDLTALEGRFNTLIADAPEAYDTLKEITDYIATHTSEYEALLAISGNKVDKVEGKGLSTNDFTDELKAKLNELYTKAQLDTKFKDLQDAVDANTGAINILNSGETVEGSVDYKIKQANTTLSAGLQEQINTNKQGIADNKAAIEAINADDTGILAQAKNYTNTETAKKGAVYAQNTEPANLGDYDLWIYLQD